MTEDLDKMLDDFVRDAEMDMIKRITSSVLSDSLFIEYAEFMLEVRKYDTFGTPLRQWEYLQFESQETLIYYSAILFKMSKNWPKSIVTPKKSNRFKVHKPKFKDYEPDRTQLVSSAAKLEYRDTVELLQDLSPDTQFTVYQWMSGNSLSSIYSLIKVLHRTKLELNALYDPLTGDFNDFLDSMFAAANRLPNKSTLHLDTLTENFKKAIEGKTITSYKSVDFDFALRRFDRLQATVLALFTLLYGENSVFEVIERLSSADSGFSPMQMMHILDDWDNLQDYPAEWILESR